MEILFELIVVIMGLWCIVFYKLIAAKTVWFYSKFFGFSVSENVSRVVFFVSGIILLGFGLLSIFQII